MSNYTPITDFDAKDTLPTGDPLKVVRGAEIMDEFQAIQTAIASKTDLVNPDGLSLDCGSY